MDPLYASTPRASASFALPHEPGVSLYYEQRGEPSARAKVVLLMGSLATLKHFDELADRLAAGCTAEVLTFDYRGIGRSTASPRTRLRSQSSGELAQDALALLEHVGGGGGAGGGGGGGGAAHVHVYGASMGGMVAQRLALLLLRGGSGAAPRLALRSLTLAVTASSYGLARFVPLGARFYRRVLPLALPADPGAMVASLLPKVFSAAFLDAPHPAAAPRRSMRELFQERWTREYAQWFSFANLDATASQCTVAATHLLTAAEAGELRQSRVPTLVAVAEQDELIAPAAQRALAALLGAEVHQGKGGHMGSAQEFAALCERIAAHVVAAERR